MKVNFELNEEDYIHFNLFHLRNSEIVKKQIKRNQFSSAISIIVIGIVIDFIIMLQTGSFEISLIVVYLIISILMYFFYPKYTMNRVAKRSKKSLSEDVKKTMFTHYEFEFSEEGIVEKTPYNETKMNWQAIISFKEDNDYFYLYLNQINGYIIPKKACENQEELRNLINKSLK